MEISYSRQIVILWSGKAKVRDRSHSYEARFFNAPVLTFIVSSMIAKAHLITYEISVHKVYCFVNHLIMPDIHHLFTINSPATAVFAAISTPSGLNSWWTVESEGQAVLGATYRFFFSPEYDWRAEVVSVVKNQHIYWEMRSADADWSSTSLHFDIEETEGVTSVRFQHQGWPEVNDHFRRSSYCWAMYFQKMKAYIE